MRKGTGYETSLQYELETVPLSLAQTKNSTVPVNGRFLARRQLLAPSQIVSLSHGVVDFSISH